MDATGLSFSTIPPLWIPYPDLPATFLWLAVKQFKLRQKYAEQRWPGMLAELQRGTWYWRIQLPRQLESLRMDDGNIHSWKYLDPDWSDGTVRPLTWDEFQRLQNDIGKYRCYQAVKDWGLSPLRPVSNASPGLGDTLREEDLKAAVFGKRLQLEGSRNRLHDLLKQLARERALRRAPQPPRLIVEHEPATVTHQGALSVKIDAEVTAPPPPPNQVPSSPPDDDPAPPSKKPTDADIKRLIEEDAAAAKDGKTSQKQLLKNARKWHDKNHFVFAGHPNWHELLKGYPELRRTVGHSKDP